MPGWTHAKRLAVEESFYEFLRYCYVNSRDAGRICLGKSLYEGQRRAITEIFDALEDDIHDVYILKSRQLGMSTLIRALSIFMIGIHRGLKGAIVFDSAENRAESRDEVEVMLGELPKNLKFPVIKRDNREGLILSNDSKISFMSAGVKRSKTSGTLGRSKGLSFAHCSEICSWDNDEGLEAFKNSLSDVNPDRLYIWESTARGFNQWNAIWEDARKDPAHCKCIFLGWWSKETQRIAKQHRDFRLYGLTPPSDDETRKIKEVKQLYNYDVTQEQLAWIRRKMDPAAQQEGDAEPKFEGDPTRIQEQPWCVSIGTKVGTDRGIETIDNAVLAKQTARGKILGGGVTGKARVWRLKTKLGYEFIGTANHPVITTSGEQVCLSDALGCRVRLQPPMLSKNDYWFSLVEPPAEWRVKVTTDLARFIGLFMGDGSASGKHRHSITEVSICCDKKDGDVVAECVRLFDAVFGVKAGLNARAGWITVRTGQHSVFNALHKLDLVRNDTGPTKRWVHVPWYIFQSPREVIREFLRGLFEADGFNAYETNRVALFSKYPEFIKDIQLLLLSFGITSRSVSMKKKAGDGHFYTGQQLELRTAEAIRFNDEISFISTRKQGRYNRDAYEKKWSKRRRGNSKRPVILFEDDVILVEDMGRIEDVWNLTVEGEHLFDANGILTHNTELEAFQQTGSVFFAPEKLTEQYNTWVSDDFKTFMYIVLDEFAYTQVLKAPNARMVELKVWDEPAGNDGSYVIGVDPAFGTSEANARSCIQVCRCYADGIDQVAEYAWPLITAQHLAWVVASLLGWYGSAAAEVRYALELNGPGMAVFSALKSLKYQLENGYQPKEIKDKGLTDVFKNVKTYIYNRTDSMGAGFNYHIKTTRATKGGMLEQLRNVVSTGKLHIRSAETIKEMTVVARDKFDGDVIGVPSSHKDDRVMALAFAVHCWEEKVRRNLISLNRTREAEAARKSMSLTDQVYLFQQNQFTQFFKEKRMQRLNFARQATRASWRYR